MWWGLGKKLVSRCGVVTCSWCGRAKLLVSYPSGRTPYPPSFLSCSFTLFAQLHEHPSAPPFPVRIPVIQFIFYLLFIEPHVTFFFEYEITILFSYL